MIITGLSILLSFGKDIRTAFLAIETVHSL
jgi:hypothetical protein